MDLLSGETAIFYFLTVAHLLTDFVFQGSLAVKKRGLNKYMLAHAGMMALAFFLPLIGYPAGRAVLASGILFILHIIVDATRIEINRIFKLLPGTWGGSISMGLDQVAHISIIYLLFRIVVLG